jgi:hypothetical protein
MRSIENAPADPRVLHDDELDAVIGGDAKPSRIKRFSAELYVEKVELNINQYDA